MYIPNFSFIALFGKEIGEEQHFFEVEKESGTHISPPNWLRGLIFGYVIQLLIFYRLAEKKVIFAFLTPQLPLPQIRTQLNFYSWSSSLRIIKSAINRSLLPFDRFWSISTEGRWFLVQKKKFTIVISKASKLATFSIVF